MANDFKRALVPGRGPLSRVPAPAVFLLVLTLFGVGVWVRGPVGAALLGVLVLAVAGLLAATWRLLTPSARVLRVLVLCVLVLVTASTL
ncbi:hypothetical protein [Saccharothrix coeruleofusca]|uniref:Uncharacterized protein n=1 Tax=Saccharothrix coeruleofusca TaxID=33919 RepID=A0A918AIM7_9PSEU|nr:hypothetical protein [Saccharothrix coeruleofusca]MBP2334281.1 energy-coupling factor transporter transmembrane protein EcfT [Saccharothrix coeruleofusca]GGP42205.1 hypothetical protein GCM10010185_11960 [Saccharothrix coeruleofusca]